MVLFVEGAAREAAWLGGTACGWRCPRFAMKSLPLGLDEVLDPRGDAALERDDLFDAKVLAQAGRGSSLSSRQAADGLIRAAGALVGHVMSERER